MKITQSLRHLLSAGAILLGFALPFCVAPALAGTPLCRASAGLTRFDHPLSETARHLAAGDELRIVAIGSSSTAGAGASAPDKSYPSRLEAFLAQRFPGQRITVINRGVNGEEAQDMVARLDHDVIAERPALVIWQLGTNAVIRDESTAKVDPIVHEGLRKLKEAHADVILVDPQFSPKVIAKPEAQHMVDLIAVAAKEANVDVFRRFEVMRGWSTADKLDFSAFTSPDGLHMNDWGYDCLAKLIQTSIVEAAQRPTISAGALSTPQRAQLSPSAQ
jgi:lysophospholipase L1-like esterase